MYYSYSKPCSSLPYKEAQVKFLTERMKQVGYDDNFPVVIWNGSILDGRHRYNAAELAGVNPNFSVFEGTEQEAWDYVSATNVDGTRHINNEEKQFFYVQRADALGVQSRGGERGNQYESGNTQNCVMAPSQKEHADSLGVSTRTVSGWEKERKEIAADPELSLMTSTPEGYKDAKKQLRARNAEVIREFQSLTEDQKQDTGVSFRSDRNKWRAHMTFDGKYQHLGSFDTKEEALKARRLKEKELGYVRAQSPTVPI